MSASVRDFLERGQAARARGDARGSHEAYGRAAELSRASGSARELVQALKGCAQAERDEGRSACAAPLYEEAVSVARTLGDALLLAHTVRHLGDVQMERGLLDEAGRSYDEALALYRGAPQAPLLELANALRPLALLKERLGLRAEAKELWREARSHYATAGIRVAVEESEKHLASLET
jgi:tetratricopeptide (TPR) repeat protein